MASYFFETYVNSRLPWGRMEQTDFHVANAERFVRFVQTHEKNNYPDDEKVTRDLLHCYVEYVRFIRSEFVTRGSVAVRSWLPLWDTNDLALFMMDNVFRGHMNRSDMSKLIGVCCKGTSDPMSRFRDILTMQDEFKMIREERLNPKDDSHFVKGFKNAKHVVIEYS